MFLTAIFITWLGYQFGKGQGWWGSMRSGGSTSSPGGRTGSSGVRSSRPSRGGTSRGSGAVRGVGNRIGRALGWRDAKRIHDRDQPPVTWGDAWREGIDAGRQRGRDRYDEGQQRKLEREQQRQWLMQAEGRSGEQADGAEVPILGRVFRGMERQRTCPDCGHGNSLNDCRESCPCAREDCACGTDAAFVRRDIESDHPDFSKPSDDEQRWGPPEDVDEPTAVPVPDFADGDRVTDDRNGREGTVKVRTSEPEDVAEGAPPVFTTVSWDPHPNSPNLSVETELDDDREHIHPVDSPAPTGDGTPKNEETPVSAPTAPAPSMSGEIINFDSARGVLRGISADMQNLSDAATETAAKHRATVAACDAAIDGLTAIDSDPDTIGDFLALREQAMQALEAAERAQVEAAESSSYATTVIGNIDQRHGAIEEAVRSSAHAAKIEAYRAS